MNPHKVYHWLGLSTYIIAAFRHYMKEKEKNNMENEKLEKLFTKIDKEEKLFKTSLIAKCNNDANKVYDYYWEITHRETVYDSLFELINSDLNRGDKYYHNLSEELIKILLENDSIAEKVSDFYKNLSHPERFDFFGIDSGYYGTLEVIKEWSKTLLRKEVK